MNPGADLPAKTSILIADDDASNREVLTYYLRRQGYDVLERFHPVVASCKESIAYLYAVTGRVPEAEAECRRALIIFAADEKRNGAATMAGARAFETYSEIMKMMGYGIDQVRSRIELIRKGGNPGEPAPVRVRANPRKVT